MKIIILAGGLGTRISEESHLKPKPMIELGEMPILWHIMKIYSHYGFNDFIICAGYKQYKIKEFFANYNLYKSDITFNLGANGLIEKHCDNSEPWNVTVIDTGINTQTGGRIKRASKFIEDSTFMVTYGDGVSDIDVGNLLKFHKKHEKLATITAVQPGGRFGTLTLDSNNVTNFCEKRKEDGGWINGGFMVMEPDVIDFIADDSTILEKEPLETITSNGQLMAYKHYGFWQCMDTLRDKNYLESLLNKGDAPWVKWDD